MDGNGEGQRAREREKTTEEEVRSVEGDAINISASSERDRRHPEYPHGGGGGRCRGCPYFSPFRINVFPVHFHDSRLAFLSVSSLAHETSRGIPDGVTGFLAGITWPRFSFPVAELFPLIVVPLAVNRGARPTGIQIRRISRRNQRQLLRNPLPRG